MIYKISLQTTTHTTVLLINDEKKKSNQTTQTTPPDPISAYHRTHKLEAKSSSLMQQQRKEQTKLAHPKACASSAQQSAQRTRYPNEISRLGNESELAAGQLVRKFSTSRAWLINTKKISAIYTRCATRRFIKLRPFIVPLRCRRFGGREARRMKERRARCGATAECSR